MRHLARTVTGEGGRALIEGNTFSMNRHAIASDGEPHNEYRAEYNLIVSSAPNYGGFSPYNQDFDMDETQGGYGGVAGFYVYAWSSRVNSVGVAT